MNQVFIGLGSNLDNPVQQIECAIAGLAELEATTVWARSRMYRNPPMGPQDQPEFVNAVVALSTQFTPDALLAELQAIERRQGRVRSAVHWGPRIIDLDILLFGEQVIDAPNLRVPHPGIADRAFVLVPLVEIAPALEIPVLGSVQHLLEAIDTSVVVAIESALSPGSE